MALQTDDCDIRDVRFYTSLGANGDYYITLLEYPKLESSRGANKFKVINYRMAMSEGQTTGYSEVRNAMTELFRAMEKAGLNKHPLDDKAH